VALGVAVVVSIDLAVQSSRRAFRISSEAVAGRATHRLEAGPAGLDEALFTRIRVETGATAAPVVEGFASSPAVPGRALRVLGIDPFSEGPFRPWLAGGGPGVDPSALLTSPGAVLLSEGTAADADVTVGDSIPLVVAGRRWLLPVGGVLRPEGELSRQGLRDLVVTDVSWAQEILDRVGRLSRIELRVEDGAAGQATLAGVTEALPEGVALRAAGTRTATMEEMIRAFDLNLTALSLLALVFGGFLIYNTLTFSVVQRRETLGTVRALGVTRREVLGLVLGEAAVVGALGSALGLGLGVVLGRGMVRLGTRTINDLYFVVSVGDVSVPPSVLAKGALLGVGATLVAAAIPAREAASAPPRAALTRSVVEERWRRLVPRTAVAGVVLLAVGSAALILVQDLLVSFGALFAILLGMALLTPATTVVLMALVRPVADRFGGILATMATRGVVTTLSRTAPAIAALTVAVSVTVGLGIMIASFRTTLGRWLERTLQADVYVSLPSPVASRADGTLDPEVVRLLTTAPGVSGASTYRGVHLDTRYGATRVVALDLDPRGERSFDFAEGTAAAAFRAFRGDGAVLVSEPFAYRHGLRRGSEVVLPTPSGEHPFPVAAVFYDYGSDQGVVMMSRETYDRHWEDRGVTSLGLFLAEGVAVETAVDELEDRVASVRAGPARAPPAVVIRSNRALREASLEVFDRTFAITGVLRALAFVVAFIGVLSALMALQLERVRELGVLRANGMTPGQVWKLVTAQTGLMGATSGLLAVPAGLVLAVVMIQVVNKRSFGWTLRMDVGADVLVQAVGLALVGALLAGVYPAWRMSRTRPSEALRSE
jgi:putative ABC transport system permease protein